MAEFYYNLTHHCSRLPYRIPASDAKNTHKQPTNDFGTTALLDFLISSYQLMDRLTSERRGG